MKESKNKQRASKIAETADTVTEDEEENEDMLDMFNQVLAAAGEDNNQDHDNRALASIENNCKIKLQCYKDHPELKIRKTE